MKLKIYLWLVLWLTVCNSYASVTWKVWNTDYRVDTTFHAKIGPGTTQTSLLLTGPDTTLTVFYLTVDLTDPYGYKDSVRYGSFSRCSNCYTDGGKS